VRFGGFDEAYSFQSRFEEGQGTNPEELVAAAHAGCFSMALSHGLSQAGHEPKEVRTTAKVHLEKTAGGFAIPRIELDTVADVPGIEDAAFQRAAEDAKKNCPVSKLFTGAEISLKAKLASRSQ
jgi:osmotically inducible protein OsmC